MFKYSVGKSVVPKEIKAEDIEVIYGDGRNQSGKDEGQMPCP